MVIQLPKETEDRLRELADREGRQPEQLVRELIDERLARETDGRSLGQPITLGAELGAEATVSEDDVWGDTDPPWAALIGMFSDGGVDSEKFEDWLEAERASDERLARKSSRSG